jgi:membrane protein YdbS with pleckstrin-like domain
MSPAEALADVQAPAIARELEDGEIVLLIARPSARLIPAYVAAPLVILLTAAAVVWAGRLVEFLSVEKADGMFLVLACVAVLVLAVQVYRWRSRCYILTNRRVLRQSGLLYLTLHQCPLVHVTNVEVILFPPEHLTHLGSVCFQTREGFRPDLRWGNLARPDLVAEEVRQALRHNHG